MSENKIIKDLFISFKNLLSYKSLNQDILNLFPDNKEYLSKERELSYNDYLKFFSDKLPKNVKKQEKAEVEEEGKAKEEAKAEKAKEEAEVEEEGKEPKEKAEEEAEEEGKEKPKEKEEEGKEEEGKEEKIFKRTGGNNDDNLQELIKKIKKLESNKTYKDLYVDFIIQIIKSGKIIKEIKINPIHEIEIIDKDRFKLNGKEYDNIESFNDYIKLLEIDITEKKKGGRRKRYKGGYINIANDDLNLKSNSILYQFLYLKDKLKEKLFNKSEVIEDYEEVLRILNDYYFNNKLKELDVELENLKAKPLLKSLATPKPTLKSYDEREEFVKKIDELLEKYSSDINTFPNLKIKLGNHYGDGIKDALLYQYDGTRYSLTIEDILKNIDYLFNEIIRYNTLRINKLKESKALIDFLNHRKSKGKYKYLKSLINKKIDKTEELDTTFLKTKYENAEKFMATLTEEQIATLNEPAKLKEKVKMRNKLYTFNNLYDYEYGEWKTDVSRTTDSAIQEQLRTNQGLYDKYMTALAFDVDISNIKFTEEYAELKEYGDKLINVKRKLDAKERISRDDIDFIKIFGEKLQELKQDIRYKEDSNYKNELKRLEDIFEVLNKGQGEDGGIIAQLDKIDESLVRDVDTIYFDDYTYFFNIVLVGFVYISLILVFFILFLSFVAVVKLVYDIVLYAIYLFINPAHNTNNNTLEYISKRIINCKKDNYADDRFYILTEQKQNLIIFNLGAYTIYLLIIYLLLYMGLLFYSQMSGYKFLGTLDAIDPTKLFLIVIGILILYSFIHLMIFKFLFKTYVYIPYKNVEIMETEVDKMLAEIILIRANDDTNSIISDDNFFELLFDASKIDKINEIFYNGIITRDNSKCLEQKVIIYNLYCYLREYTTFDEEMRTLFKKYCISDENNKPFDERGNKVTFISLLSAGETKMMRKYHDELPFVNQIPDKHLDFFNEFNKRIGKKVKDINMKIINYTKTSIPFFITIIYIFLIFLLNYIIVYIILSMILSNADDNKFNQYIIKASYYIKIYIYDPLLNFFLKEEQEGQVKK